MHLILRLLLVEEFLIKGLRAGKRGEGEQTFAAVHESEGDERVVLAIFLGAAKYDSSTDFLGFSEAVS